MWGISSAGRALAWHARGQRFDPAILHQKSTVLRRKYSAFLFVEADFWGLHWFACTVFRLCRRFRYTPQRLTLHHFQKGMFAARFFSRLPHHPLQCTAYSVLYFRWFRAISSCLLFLLFYILDIGSLSSLCQLLLYNTRLHFLSAWFYSPYL